MSQTGTINGHRLKNFKQNYKKLSVKLEKKCLKSQ